MTAGAGILWSSLLDKCTESVRAVDNLLLAYCFIENPCTSFRRRAAWA